MRLDVDLVARPTTLGLALEEAVLDSVRQGGPPLVRLWIGQSSIVIGRSQRIGDEVDMAEARRRGVPVLRRISGGGAVVHYPGNLNVTVILRAADRFRDVGQTFARFGEALAEGLGAAGLAAVPDGNALLVDGRKVSGAAQARRGEALLYHCTLLVLPDDGETASLLRAGRTDYAPRGVSSRHRATTTLSEARGSRVTMREACDLVLQGLSGLSPSWDREELSRSEVRAAGDLVIRRYEDESWNALR